MDAVFYDEEGDGVRRTLDAEGNLVWWEYLEPETFRLSVDGELFEVSHVNDRAYSYTWLTGRDPSYGFTSSGNVPGIEFDHETSIREFLAAVDPETGYIED